MNKWFIYKRFTLILAIAIWDVFFALSFASAQSVITNAGLGCSDNKCIWLNLSNFTPGSDCSLNIYKATDNTLLASRVTPGQCSSGAKGNGLVTFRIPENIYSSNLSIRVSVVNNRSETQPYLVKIRDSSLNPPPPPPSAPAPTVTPTVTPSRSPSSAAPVARNTGLGCLDNVCAWISLSPLNTKLSCHVNIYSTNEDLNNPTGSSVLLREQITPGYCGNDANNVSGTVTFRIPDDILNSRQKILISVVNGEESNKIEALLRPNLFPSKGVGVGYNVPDLVYNLIGVEWVDDIPQRIVRKEMGLRAIADAYHMGAQHLAIFLPGYFPTNVNDVLSNRNDLLLWDKDPAAYWKKIDLVFTEITKYGMGVLVRGWGDSLNFTSLASIKFNKAETLVDFLTKADSNSFKLYKQYWEQLISRYSGRGLIAVGLPNELSLGAELDLEARCEASLSQNCTTLWNTPSTLRSNSIISSCVNDTNTSEFIKNKRLYCSTYKNFTTSQLIQFEVNAKNFIKAINPNMRITGAHGMPRASAEHLRVRPEWIQENVLNPLPSPRWLYDSPDWTRDTAAQTSKNIKDLSYMLEFTDLHLYGNPGTYNDWVPLYFGTVQSMGNQLYFGELGDDMTHYSASTFEFTKKVISSIGSPYFNSASVWALEFFQFNTYQFQGADDRPEYNYPIPIDSANPNIASLTSLMIQKRDLLSPGWKNGNVLSKGVRSIISNPYFTDGRTVSSKTVFNVLASTGLTSSGGRISKVEVYLRNAQGNLILSKTLSQWPFQFPIGQLGSGRKFIVTKAYDSSGNVSGWSTPVDVTIGQ